MKFWFYKNRDFSFVRSNWIKAFKVTHINYLFQNWFLCWVIFFLLTLFKFFKLLISTEFLSLHSCIFKIYFFDYIIFLQILSKLLKSFRFSVTWSMRPWWINVYSSNGLKRLVWFNSVRTNHWLFIWISNSFIKAIFKIFIINIRWFTLIKFHICIHN